MGQRPPKRKWQVNFNKAPPTWKDVPVYRKITFGPWKSWYAWRPIKLHGEWFWLDWVFRRTVTAWADMNDLKHYQYGSMFDVLKGDE